MSQLTSDLMDNIPARPDSAACGSSGKAFTPARSSGAPRWSVTEVKALLDLPFNDLIHRAHLVQTER